MLRALCRHPHRVVTGLYLVAPDGRERGLCSVSTVRMKRLSPRNIERLAAEPGALQRAGAYALRPADPNVASLEGSASGVMGLPVEQLRQVLLDLYPDCGRTG